MALAEKLMALGSLSAIVFDSETTGLDARVARMIQLGAIAITDGEVDPTRTFDQLIDPGTKIPPETIAVHGITDAAVAGKPKFVDVIADFKQFAGHKLLIGHSIFYDFAVLKKEYELAGMSWVTPPALDIRTLARIAAPGLADHSLDRLCEWLGVSNAGRHTAIGDAVATAEVFVKLVPLLRQRGIRTVAEAGTACARLAEHDAQTSGGLIAVESATPQEAPALARLDAFAFRHRVSDVMSAPAAFLPGDATIAEAIALMLEKSYSSVLVSLDGGASGIVTERDTMRALHSQGPQALQQPLSAIAKTPLHTVYEHDHIYRAIGRMDRLRIRHLAVRSDDGEIVGMLTPRNLLRNRASTAIALGDEIAAADSVARLAAVWSQVPPMAASLMREEIDARTIAGIVSAEIRGITGRAAHLAEAEMRRQGKGGAPTSYAVMVLGSAGRGESLLAADQDNAIIFDHGEPGGPEDLWFAEMATLMASYLDQIGIVFCKGGVMAKSAQWRHSKQGWSELVAAWVRRQKPQDLLDVDIFFDAELAHGQRELVDDLTTEAYATAARSRDFLMMLTELARQWSSPIGMLGGFQKTDGRLDLKKYGMMPIFTATRVLALRHGVNARSTADRLEGVLEKGIGSRGVVDRVLAAQEVLMRAVLQQQLADGQNGIPLSPRVDVDRIDKAGRRTIKEAIESVPLIIDLVSEGRL